MNINVSNAIGNYARINRITRSMEVMSEKHDNALEKKQPTKKEKQEETFADTLRRLNQLA